MFNNRKGNVIPPEPSNTTTARPEHSNAAETQENNFKNNFMKKIEALKGKMKSFLEEIEKNKQTKN